MSETEIVYVHGRRVWDSRGRPTVEAEVVLANGAVGRAIAPAGANRSTFEGCYCEEHSGLNWDVAAPGMIIAPKGAMPDTRAADRNITLAPMHGGGWATGTPMTL